MKIQSHDLARFADEFLTDLKKATDKVKKYCSLEYDKKGQSNFVLDIPDADYEVLDRIAKDIAGHGDIPLVSDAADELFKKYKERDLKFKEFELLCDNVYKSANGSLDQLLFTSSFSMWVKETVDIIQDLYNLFIEKSQIKDIINHKEEYERILREASLKDMELKALINSVTEKTHELTSKLEQNVAEHSVADIKLFYKKLKRRNWVAKTFYGILFFTSAMGLIGGLGYVFWNMEWFYNNDFLLIPKSVLSCTIIGLTTFIINDLRKRFNISKHILDELNQKELVIDTYSSLLSRIKDFDDDTKKIYHEKIIQNIINSLLTIRNHGYLSKLLNDSKTNIGSELIEELGKLIPVK